MSAWKVLSICGVIVLGLSACSSETVELKSTEAGSPQCWMGGIRCEDLNRAHNPLAKTWRALDGTHSLDWTAKSQVHEDGETYLDSFRFEMDFGTALCTGFAVIEGTNESGIVTVSQMDLSSGVGVDCRARETWYSYELASGRLKMCRAGASCQFYQ